MLFLLLTAVVCILRAWGWRIEGEEQTQPDVFSFGEPEMEKQVTFWDGH